jgi:ABC-type phosphate transport system substrate-binding protein
MKCKPDKQKKIFQVFLTLVSVVSLSSCADYFKNDYDDNSPTSGKLKVYYDEGLELHVKNQAYTFVALYTNAQVELFRSSESQAVQALYNDSCEAIVISRPLNDKEKKAFESKSFFPSYSEVAKSGILLLTNIQTPISHLSVEEIRATLAQGAPLKDSTGNEIKINILFDKNNSSVIHYMLDSVLRSQKLSSICNILNSSVESINYVANNPNTIAFIDFAWLSDKDDSLFKANQFKIKFLALSKLRSDTFYFPDQSNFKLGNYPLTRSVYVYRKTGDFTLAKGFESFVAGPKGQLTFLKQGLLPTRQSERALKIKTGN